MRMPAFAAAVVASCAALASAGCCCYPAPACGGPPHGVLAPASCDPPCETGCAAPVEACFSCGRNGPCPKHHGSRGLLGYLRESFCCTSGCGELYVHPWVNDPPHPCDPCDDWGNYPGHRPCGPAGCGAGACPVSWRGLWGQRSDVAYAHGGPTEMIHDGHYTGEMMDGAILEGPTPAEPLLVPPGQEIEEEEDVLPSPPPQPRAAGASGARKTRSALKKVDGQPAVYYNRQTR